MIGVLTRRFGQRLLSFAPQRAITRGYVTKYTESHEWVKIDKNIGTVGVTDYAQKELGDIVYVEVPEVGMQTDPDTPVGVVESVKSTSDIYSPLTGEIVEANQSVVSKTKLINTAAESDGWLFKVKFSSQDEVDKLLDATQYKELIGSDH
ncbi:glycine cleavage system H-protein subunit [Coemansia sp. RSA 988]|nr:glycine cleavage system H-protein subunit [Coemansia sp. RSA 988]